MKDTTHLVALYDGLAREKQRLLEAKTVQESALRTVWVSQKEREIAREMEFLGTAADDLEPLSDDDLLAALLG